MQFLLERWYALPAISGVLLMLVFYPFYFWPLACVVLAPLFYVASSARYSSTQVFLGGALAGALGIGPLVYFSLVLLRILPDALAFSYLIRLSSVPALLLVACLFGLMALAYHGLRPRNILLASIVGASLYTCVEAALLFVFGGYYLGSLAHAVVPFVPALAYAALGGAALVSFIVVWINVLVAEGMRAWQDHKKEVLHAGAIAALALTGAYGGYALLLMPAYESSPKVSFAIIQLPYNVSINELPFGSYDGHTFSNSALEALIREASKQAEVVIYPFSPVQGSVYINADATATPTQDDVPHEVLGMWLADVAPSSAVLFWVAAVDGHNLYDQYLLWQRGRMSEYQKQALYPLSDYEPGWSRLVGLPARHKEVAAGQGGVFGFGKGAASGLICSELHQGALARARAKEVALIVAVGSDAMFPGELAGTFSLAAARLRAAEHSTSLLRGNINGPSALVNPDGSLVAKLEYREEGILYGVLPAEEFSETPFARTGPSPLYVSVVVVVGVAWYLRWRS